MASNRLAPSDAQAARRQAGLQVGALADDLEEVAQRLRERATALQAADPPAPPRAALGREGAAEPADRVVQVHEELVGELRAVPDLLERVQAAQGALEANGVGQGLLARVVEEAVWTWHHEQGVSYAEIGRQLGVGRSRATELGARWVRGKVRPPRS